MFFKGFFLSLLSLITIIGITSFISHAEFHFSRRICPVLLGLGIILLFTALWISSLWLSVIFCSAALTLLYAAHTLQQNSICRRGRGGHKSNRHPRF